MHLETLEVLILPITKIVSSHHKWLCSSFMKAHCQVMDEKITCEGSMFWEKGFVAFQAAINAAIIEVSIS